MNEPVNTPVDPLAVPFEPLVDETTTADDGYDMNVETRAAAIRTQASFPSDMVDPGQVYGDGWQETLLADPDAGLKFGIDWDFNMTQGQKISLLTAAASERRWNAFNDEVSDIIIGRTPDPQRAAQDIIASRMQREGR